MRIMPQDQDTGGFFCALLEKTGPVAPPAHQKPLEFAPGMLVETKRKGGKEKAVVVAESQAKKGQWVIQFESDGKQASRAPELMVAIDDVAMDDDKGYAEWIGSGRIWYIVC
jgi:hypothetical protein